MVGRREGRHPDDAATQLDAVIHRVPVDAAHRTVERHAGKQIDIEMAEMAAQQFRDRISRIEMILAQYLAQAGVAGFLERLDMIEVERHHHWAALAMTIARPTGTT